MAVSQERQVTIGDTTVRLQFDLRCIFALQDAWELENDNEVLDRLAAKKGLRDLVTLFWALCRTHNPEITQDEALNLLSADDLAGLASTFEQIMIAAMPPPKPGASPPPGQRKPRTR